MNHSRRIAVIGLIASSALATSVFADDNASSVEGAWGQVEQKNGPSQEYRKLPDGTMMTDCQDFMIDEKWERCKP